jgi:hypothetical protein
MTRLDDFFSFGVKDFRGSLGVEWLNFDPRWHDYKSFKLGKKKPNQKHPVRYRVTTGKDTIDFIGDDLAPLISENAVKVLSKSKLSGWSTYPVEVLKKNGRSWPNKYYGMSIKGRAGPIDMKRGVKETFKETDGRLTILSMHGLHFDTRSWDGSDFFCLQDSGFILVTKRVVEVLSREKLKGWKFRKLKDVTV